MIAYILISGAVAWGLLMLAGCADLAHTLHADQCTPPTQQEAAITKNVWKANKRWN